MRDRASDILHVVPPYPQKVTVREIMGMLGVEPGHTYRVVNSLVDKGFLSKWVSGSDGIAQFNLTSKGEKAYLSMVRLPTGCRAES